MRAVGIFVLIAAAIGLLVSINMDVSVASIDGSRVINLGLIAQRNSIQTISGFAAVCGVIMVAFGRRRAAQASADGERVPCPYCAEAILRAARVCKHCHTEITPAAPEPNGDEAESASSDGSATHAVKMVVIAAVVAALFVLMARGCT